MSDDVRTEMNIDESKHDTYNRITNDEGSLFYKSHDTDVFIAAASVGYYYKKREPIVGRKRSIYPMNLYRKDHHNLWMLKAIAIATEGIEVLRDLRKVASIVEAYANAGIDILYKMHKENKNEVDEMALLLLNIIEEEGIKE